MSRTRRFGIRFLYLLLYLSAAVTLLGMAFVAFHHGGVLYSVSFVLGAGSLSLMILVLREMIVIVGLVIGRQVQAELLKGIVLTVMTVGLCLVLLEGILWLQEKRAPAEAKGRTRALPLTMPEEWKKRTVEIPNTTKAYYWHGKLHVFDENMMRRTTPFPAKRDDTFRIIVIGDSLTYGLGVDEEDTYPRVLEKELRKRYRVEVLNLGVCGFDSEELVEVVERFAPLLKPDLILYGLCLNDFLPRFVPNVDGYPFPLPRSFKEMMVKHTRVGQFLNREYNDLLLRLNLRPNLAEKILHRFPSYRKRFAQDLRIMNAFAADNGFGPIIAMVVDQWPTKQRRQAAELAEKAAAEAGMIVIPTADYYRMYENRQEKELIELVVSRWELHPNEKTHARFAELFLSVVSRLPALNAYAVSSGRRITQGVQPL